MVASTTETAGTLGALQFFAAPLYPDLSADAEPTAQIRRAVDASLGRAVSEAKAPHIERLARYRSVVVREWLSTGRGVGLERIAQWLVDPEGTRVLLRPDDIREGATPFEGDNRPVCGDRWLDFEVEAEQEGRQVLRRMTAAGGDPAAQRTFETTLLEAVRRRLADEANGQATAGVEDDALTFGRIQQRQGSSLLPAFKQHASIYVRLDPHAPGSTSLQTFVIDDGGNRSRSVRGLASVRFTEPSHIRILRTVLRDVSAPGTLRGAR